MSKSVRLIYFSPTKTTEKMAKALAKGVADNLGYNIKETIDLRYPEAREKSYTFSKDDILVMGLPVYEGRVIPNNAEVIKKMKGDGTLAIIGMVYGNRDFEDSIREMKELLESAGFRVVSAAAFIGQHSFSTKVAAGRPDAEDLKLIADFAKKSAEKAKKIIDGGEFTELEVTGNFPYKDPLLVLKQSATTNENCIECMICVNQCPTRAISEDDPRVIDFDKCMWCQACVRFCPQEAKAFDEPRAVQIIGWLEYKFQDRKAPTIFL